MRDATLGTLSALDAVRPGRAGPGRPRQGGGKGRPTTPGRGQGFKRFRGRLALIVGSAGFSAIMIGIVLNATVMQKGHHPAPLFVPPEATAPARTIPLTPPRPEPVASVPAPLPAVATVPAEPPAAPVLPSVASAHPAAPKAPAAKPAAHPLAHAAPKPATVRPAPAHAALHHADPIAKLLGSGPDVTSPPRHTVQPAHAAKPAPKALPAKVPATKAPAAPDAEVN